MSSIEIAGLTLAVLPMLLSAVQKYNNCLSPFGRYKRFAKEAQGYYRELDVQRIIFRSQCRGLLEEIVDHDEASSMLNSLTQKAWTNKYLDVKLAQQLGESLEACISIIELIEQRLQDIGGESEGFKSIVEQEKKTTPKPARNKLWRRNLGEKIRFSFSKSRLDENIAKLRSHNDDLRTLILQTRPYTSIAKRVGSNTSRATRNDLRKYQTIGKASCQVYEAFRKACTKHTEHIAYFRTEVEQIILDKESSPQVKFDMAFTHRVLSDTSSGDPIWFLVDSIINEHMDTCTSARTTCMHNLKQTLKRQLNPTLTQAAKRVKKSVSFASIAPVSSSTPSLPLSTSTLACIGIDFCDHLRRHFRQPLLSNACVVLENTAQCKQLVYPSHHTACSELRKGTSLEQLITSTTTSGSVDGILLHERVSLAKMLAIAVLQYHATPWLRLSWRSDEIFFFGIEADTQVQKRPNLSAPYINAKIKGDSAKIAEQRSAIARNPVLFSLGVVLLELAYSARLESLKLPCDAENGQLFSDFFAARRLAKSKRSLMGSVYNNIAEQLVECAFPCGDDLNNPQLQVTFYEDVICPLDELEQGLQKLYIGEPDG